MARVRFGISRRTSAALAWTGTALDATLVGFLARGCWVLSSMPGTMPLQHARLMPVS